MALLVLGPPRRRRCAVFERDAGRIPRRRLRAGQHGAPAGAGAATARDALASHGAAARSSSRDDGGHWFNYGFLLEEAGATTSTPKPRSAARRELRPELDRAWYGLGLVLIRLQRLDEAVAALKRNTQLQPMSPYGWYQLARVHVDRHEPEEARKIIRHLKQVRAESGRPAGARDGPARLARQLRGYLRRGPVAGRRRKPRVAGRWWQRSRAARASKETDACS